MKHLRDRHELLEQFLRLIVVSKGQIYQDVEGIEHHLSWNSIHCIQNLVRYLGNHPELVRALLMSKKQRQADPET